MSHLTSRMTGASPAGMVSPGLNGVSRREKFRIRYYNGDTGVIHLEKKSKLGGLGNKQSAELSVPEVSALLQDDLSWMLDSGRPLVRELYSKMCTQQLRPKTIVDYTQFFPAADAVQLFQQRLVCGRVEVQAANQICSIHCVRVCLRHSFNLFLSSSFILSILYLEGGYKQYEFSPRVET